MGFWEEKGASVGSVVREVGEVEVGWEDPKGEEEHLHHLIQLIGYLLPSRDNLTVAISTKMSDI